jgi:alpha-galactosidase
VAIALIITAPAAAQLEPSPTPYMGADTWYAFGPNLNEVTVAGFTHAVVARGLADAGYRYVWLDAGWWHGARDRHGNIVVNRQQWPDGLRWLTSYIHAQGLLAGIYTGAGAVGCENGGSYGHYQADVDRFAAWGFDAVKVDFCGANKMHLDPRVVYRQFRAAIDRDRPDRPMLFAICNASLPNEYGQQDPPAAQSAFGSYAFAPRISDSWRTGPDLGAPGMVTFTSVLRNLDLDAKHGAVAGPGHWNDPDYLTPGQGMTLTQARAQFTMWTILAAPLVVSANLSALGSAVTAMLTNRRAIAINQDPRGVQGRLVVSIGGVEVWIKPLADGARAVALLNRGSSAESVRVDSQALGFGRQPLLVDDVWQGRSARSDGAIRATVPAGGAVLLRVARAGRR